MLGTIQTIIYLYTALFIVILLHEIGHFPKKIKFKFGIIPSASAMYARYRVGGLIVNIILFILVYIYKPENILFQYVGFIAWAHFIIYSILGSIIPEPHESQVDISTYVFDDVDNKLWYLFIGAAIISYYFFNSYYLSILRGMF